MKITIDNIEYETIYFPFYRIKKHKQFTKFGLRYPSGFIEDIVVFDATNYMEELRGQLEYTLREYGLEEDDMLTPKAMELKRNVRDLFGLD